MILTLSFHQHSYLLLALARAAADERTFTVDGHEYELIEWKRKGDNVDVQLRFCC